MNNAQNLQTPANRELRLAVVESIGAVDASAWDSCANPKASPACDPLHAPPAAPALDHTENEDLSYNPFVSYAFLSALEESKSVGPRTGWQPRHILARTSDGALLAAAPCYLKSHSRGEYVFDHGWAEAYERAGGSYYPKLQIGRASCRERVCLGV